jgi:hypothetical protein
MASMIEVKAPTLPSLGNTTELLLKQFGLCAEELRQLVKDTNSYIAGGFALETALRANDSWKNNTLNTDPFHGDIDIWVRGRDVMDKKLNRMETDYSTDVLCRRLYKYVLQKFGYEEHTNTMTSKENPELPYRQAQTPFRDIVANIDTYIHKETKHKIQVIVTHDVSIEDNLKSFDFSFCRWCLTPNGRDRGFTLMFMGTKADYDDCLNKRTGYWYGTEEDMKKPRTMERIAKYKIRGMNVYRVNVTNITEFFKPLFVSTTPRDERWRLMRIKNIVIDLASTYTKETGKLKIHSVSYTRITGNEYTEMEDEFGDEGAGYLPMSVEELKKHTSSYEHVKNLFQKDDRVFHQGMVLLDLAVVLNWVWTELGCPEVETILLDADKAIELKNRFNSQLDVSVC